MALTFHTIQSVLMMGVVCALILVAGRRREWRGGLMAMAFIFLGVAINELKVLNPYLRQLAMGEMNEPEVIPIFISLIFAVGCIFYWRGSTRAALFEVWRNRRFWLLIWGLLFVSLLANGIRNRHLWEVMAPDIKDTWLLRLWAQEMTKVFGHFLLINWAILFFFDEWKRLVHRASPHEHLLKENELIEIGQGARRVCYRIGETGYCVKFLRDESDTRSGRKIGWRFRQMLMKGRFDQNLNLNCLEAQAMVRCRLEAGAEVAEAFPEVIEIVFDEKRGYGILMTLVTNADGSNLMSADDLMLKRKDRKFAALCYPQLKKLLEALVDIAAPFFEPCNIQAQILADGTPRMRLIDFEPVDKKLFPVAEWVPFIRQADLARRSKEFLKGLRELYELEDV